ncbi:beta and beta-prime subunits of DNA dependent RNA-polymerase [Pluteus cervinus]|uniref:Beta and beta-prime subunits of DNA dependent RNA-polymerase n=1 Tax=Pluteus cervinus TaxID=181527 RepID=A0ACD3B1W4_9AGAR|nr:beta and beta-prime subunits of DNA dependent RNA-polymerase [Pluteus cervinus]
MNIAHSLPSTVTGISFSFLSSQDIRRISVKQIVNATLLDDLNRPNIGGLYDPALGPVDRQDICATCHLTYFTCPGHFGHIELVAPVFHPLFMNNMFNLLRGTCLFCHHFKLSRIVVYKYIAKLTLLENGLLDAAQGVDDLMPRVSKRRQKKAEKEDKMDVDGEGPVSETKVVPPPAADEPKDETNAEFIVRLDLYVKVHLARVGRVRRDNYKEALVYKMRKDVIQEFLKAILVKQCQNGDCGCPSYTFRKEGHVKVIELDLPGKAKARLSRKRPNVLLEERASELPSAKEKQANALDSDIEMSDPDDEEDEEEEDEDQEEVTPGDPFKKTTELPRTASGKVKTAKGRNERVMPPEECRAHLRRLFRNERIICSLLFGRHGAHAPVGRDGFTSVSADMFFLEVLPVSPTRFRPAAKMNETLFEHPQNELLSRVINSTYRLRDLNKELHDVSQKTPEFDEANRKRVMSALLDRLVQLQVDVNSFMDSNKNPQPRRQGKLPPAGVKQGLEKKEGLFRKNMMGKRVNYAARSVISPDVNIEPNEIGIPPVFARKLTFPEPVTAANFHEMRQRVIVGPRGYPGATIVEYEDGKQISLDKMTVEQRTAIANQLLTPQEGVPSGRRGLTTRTAAVNKKVYRHLVDGDVVILNRQPTLHKPSMMTHVARVLQGEKTIRMHYANCNSYNADFDGDEMNIHFPQNQVARAEAMFLANTDNQYLVPTSGNPLRGLIQDHVVAGVWMTNQDTFFDREEYHQLLYGALRPEDGAGHRLVTLPPAIWKPQPLWTGKQIISTILTNITPGHFEGLNLQAETKVPGHLWGKDSKEDQVLFMGGELLCGVLDKAAFGASDYGLVHSVHELYGAEIAGKLLGILSRLFTKFLQHRAFSCRMDDLVLTPEGNSQRRILIEKGRNLGTEGAIENFPSLKDTPRALIPTALTSLLQDVLRDDEKMAGLDMTVKTKLSELTTSIAKACIPGGLFRSFPHNNMQTMTLSGAKGTAVNARQISCALGQQELEGRRVPVMVSGKTLPSFRPFETKAIAGGYIASRFLTGIKPQEFYFHCMAGREGLIDTAVKTSRSGYLQRCLIKHLEGIRVHYDHTVRGSDNSIYQFYYGGDALDVTKQKHLYQFDFIAQNEISLLNRLQPRQVSGVIDDTTAARHMKKVLKKSAERPNRGAPSKRDKLQPVMSLYSPGRFLGSTSETFAVAVDQYAKTNPKQLLESEDSPEWLQCRKSKIHPRNFRLLMNIKYLKSLVEPGEAVGLLASQGVGEPSTQMTLNTFHFAGHGAANVTLGIPRLREIVMTASQKPKTPSMIMTIREGVSQEDIDLFCKRASRVTLSQVVDSIDVREQMRVTDAARRTKYSVEMKFFPKAEYRDAYDVEPSEILAVFAGRFPLLLKKEMQIEMKKLDEDLKSQIRELGKGKKAKDNEGDAEEGDEVEEEEGAAPKKRKDDDEISEVGDGDADDQKRLRQRQEQATYESDEDEDEEEESDEDGEQEGGDSGAPDEETETKVKKNARDGLAEQSKRVADLFQQHFHPAISFDFDESRCLFELEFGSEMPKLLFVGVIERACRFTVIREIPGISACFQNKEKVKGGEPIIKLTTNGSNLRGMWNFATGSGSSIVDEDDIYSNDIYAMLTTYGVEVARAAILREMSGVFGVYNIKVDRRHLELIADYMTFDGGYKPFNRKGISTNPSPLLKASYETTAAFLSDATLYGDFDDLSTPSGNIVLGRPNKTGTGVFDVFMPLINDPVAA